MDADGRIGVLGGERKVLVGAEEKGARTEFVALHEAIGCHQTHDWCWAEESECQRRAEGEALKGVGPVVGLKRLDAVGGGGFKLEVV
jgi:hypothetical protein